MAFGNQKPANLGARLGLVFGSASVVLVCGLVSQVGSTSEDRVVVWVCAILFLLFWALIILPTRRARIILAASCASALAVVACYLVLHVSLPPWLSMPPDSKILAKQKAGDLSLSGERGYYRIMVPQPAAAASDWFDTMLAGKGFSVLASPGVISLVDLKGQVGPWIVGKMLPGRTPDPIITKYWGPSDHFVTVVVWDNGSTTIVEVIDVEDHS